MQHPLWRDIRGVDAIVVRVGFVSTLYAADEALGLFPLGFAESSEMPVVPDRHEYGGERLLVLLFNLEDIHIVP